MNTKKYFALSDIHGRDINLSHFVKKGFELKNPNHIIVLVGDYFDRNEKNLLVLRFIEKYKKLLKERFIVLKGNHDEFIFNFIEYIEKNISINEVLHHDEVNLERWLRNGGDITIRQLFGPYKGKYTATKEKNLKRLKRFQNYVQDFYETDSYIFTHAAISEDRIVDVWNRDFLHQGFNTNKTTVIGHTMHKYLTEVCSISDYGLGQVAKSLQETKSPVLNIDNGLGNNIVVFSE